MFALDDHAVTHLSSPHHIHHQYQHQYQHQQRQYHAIQVPYYQQQQQYHVPSAPSLGTNELSRRSSLPSASPPTSTATMNQQIAAAKKLLRVGTTSVDMAAAEAALVQACYLLETWALDLEETEESSHDDNNDGDDSTGIDATQSNNPFYTLLAQAKHRLGQVCLLRCSSSSASTSATLEMACRLFLQVLLHDPDTLSPTALAMTWYDVGLIYLRSNNLDHAQSALEYSFTILQTCGSLVNDATMYHFVQESLQLLSFRRAEQYHQFYHDTTAASAIPQLPWSFQFTMTTYNCESTTAATAATDGSPHQFDNDQEQSQQPSLRASDVFGPNKLVMDETRQLFDPKVRHAGAA